MAEPAQQRFPRSAPAPVETEREVTWQALPKAKRDKAAIILQVIRPALALIDNDVSKTAACENLLTHLQRGTASDALLTAARRVGRNGKAPSRATIINWVTKYQDHGIVGLVAGHKGSERRTWGWEARFHYYFDRPTKPSFAAVAEWLRDDGYDTATYDRVRRYALSLPENKGRRSPKRMGRHFYNQNLRPYKMRDESVLPAGLLYEGDGHNCDVYVAHPNTGKPWRPEFTPWVDVRSHYVVGWYLSEAESAITTLFSLSKAIVHYDHVPAGIHVDPGSGFKNRLISSDAANSYCARLAIEFLSALPGNAKGKGLIEGFFGHFEEKVGKRFDTYCGKDRTDDYLRHLSAKVQRGEIVLPTLAEYTAAIAAWVERYNNTPQRRLGCAPSELWAQLERVPLEMSQDAIVRPSEPRTVRRWRVQLHNRYYEHNELAAYNDREVQVEYDLHDDRKVWVRDQKDRFICEASIVDRIPWMPVSRIEEMKKRRLKGQIARKQRAIDEDRERARLNVTHTQVLTDLEEFEGLEDFESPALADGSKEKGFVDESANPFHSPDESPSSLQDDGDWSDYL